MKKSDKAVVAVKAANNVPKGTAESLEPRALPKGNPRVSYTYRAQDRAQVSQGYRRIRQFVRQKPQERLTTLLHHITVRALRYAFYSLKRDAAAGVDGETWHAYAEGLDRRLADLHDRVHSGAYRATASRRVFIPKGDGRQRPLGIAALEDKIVQSAVAMCLLTPIYEEMFLDFSYGFRPRRKAHDALDAVAYALERRQVNYIVDADIEAFFDQVDQEWLVRFLEHRIADKRVIRLIIKWLKAGVIVEGRWQETPMGTPQGAVISPILANIYLHYVLDLWFAVRWNKGVRGEAYIVRYADDFVLGFQYRAEAERFLRDLQRRLKKFGLRLHAGKTRLIEFGRFAATHRKRRGEGRPGTFDFLGFTHYCRTTRSGRFGLGRKPMAKRMVRKLTALYRQLRRRMHEGVHAHARWLGQVLNGWLNYYAVPTSYRYLKRFRTCLLRFWHKVLRRRSQKDRTSRKLLDQLAAAHWPKLRIRHPWPTSRISVTRTMV